MHAVEIRRIGVARLPALLATERADQLAAVVTPPVL